MSSRFFIALDEEETEAFERYAELANSLSDQDKTPTIKIEGEEMDKIKTIAEAMLIYMNNSMAIDNVEEFPDFLRTIVKDYMVKFVVDALGDAFFLGWLTHYHESIERARGSSDEG